MFKFIVSVLALGYACLLSVYAGDEHLETKSKALAHYIMAEIHDFNGRGKDAVNEYARAANLDRAQPLPHLRLASYYVREGEISKAQQQLKAVSELDPNNAQAHYLMALSYSSQKKFDLAAKEFEKILNSRLENTPENFEVHTNLAQLYFSQKKFDKAIEEFQQIIILDPSNVSACYFLGTAYLEIKDNQKAIEQFKRVLALDANNDQAYNSLAYVYAEAGQNLQEALALVKKALDIDPNSGAYYDTLGWVLYKMGLYTDSLLAFQKAEVYIQDPTLFDHMADVYQAIKEFALARKYWRKSLDLDPQQSVQAKIDHLEKIQALKNQ